MFGKKYALLLLPFALITGCDSDDVKGHTCKEISKSFAMHQATPSGVIGNDFAKGAVGTYQVLLSSVGANSQAEKVSTSVIPDHTPATLTVELTPNATLSHLISTYEPCAPGANCDKKVVTCQDEFSLPIRARLTAASGVIDETWEGEIRAADPKDLEYEKNGKPDPKIYRMTLRRPASSFLNAFKVSAPKLKPNETLKSHDIDLLAKIREGKLLSGSIDTRITYHAAGAGADAPNTTMAGPLVTFTPAP